MRGFLSFLVDSLLPVSCLVCGRDISAAEEPRPAEGWIGPGGVYDPGRITFEPVAGIRMPARVLCRECWGLLERPPGRPTLGVSAASVPLVSPFYTNDALLSLVRFLKFGGGRSAAPPLAWWMAASLLELLERERGGERGRTLLVPVPLHPRRLRERGYNQALLLAEGVGRWLGLRVEPDTIVRSKNTASQSKLEEGARAANVRGAFRLEGRELVAGRHIILVDDLVTTGETARACLETILAASPASSAVLAAGRVRDSCLTGEKRYASIAPARFESTPSKGGNRALDEQGSAQGRPRRNLWGRRVQHK